MSFVYLQALQALFEEARPFFVSFNRVGGAGRHPVGVGLPRGQRLLQVPQVDGEAELAPALTMASVIWNCSLTVEAMTPPVA